MRKLTTTEADNLANSFRAKIGLTKDEPIHTKTILRKQNIFTIYRPLDSASCSISLKAPNDRKFILVNSNHPRGRQHFTIAHELYHLYCDANPKPHLCKDDGGQKDVNEYNADMFAGALLMPYDGLCQMIPFNELSNGISIPTILRLEQYFQVSRSALLVRLSRLKMISDAEYKTFSTLPKTALAGDYGYDTSLYESGNAGVVLGDYGEKARVLFDRELISEGHYNELLNLIRNDKEY